MSGVETRIDPAVVRAAEIIEQKGVPAGLDITAELADAGSAFCEMLVSIGDGIIGASGLTHFDVDFQGFSNEVSSSLLIFGGAMMVRGYELGARKEEGEI